MSGADPVTQVFLYPHQYCHPVLGHRAAKIISRRPDGSLRADAPKQFPSLWIRREHKFTSAAEAAELFAREDLLGGIPVPGVIAPGCAETPLVRRQTNDVSVIDGATGALAIDFDNAPAMTGRDLLQVDPAEMALYARGLLGELFDADAWFCISSRVWLLHG